MMIILLTLSIVVALVSIFTITHRWYKSREALYKLANQLPGPKSLPLIGNALLFNCRQDELFNTMTNLINEYPTEMRFWLGPQLVAIFRDPIQVEKIITSSKMIYKHNIYRFIQVYGGNGLISGSGPDWKVHRKLIAPFYHQKFVNLNVDILQKHVDVLLANLSKHVNKPTFDIHDDIHYCSLDFISEILFGESLNAQSGDSPYKPFIKAVNGFYNLVIDRMFKVWLHPEFIYQYTKYKDEETQFIKDHDLYVTKAIAEGRQRLKANLPMNLNKAEPTMDSILRVVDENPGVMNEQDLKHHLLTIFAASEDPMTIICSFTCYCFGMYPEYQKKAAEEIKNVFGNTQHNVTIEDLKHLIYLEWCIKDVLRLVPIAPFILRQPIEDYTFDEYKIPKECAVLIPITNIHRDPEHWKNPMHFFPDHFKPEAVEKRHHYAFLPFSGGQRGCIGQVLAMVGLKVMMVNILQRYRIEAEGKFPDVRLKSDISIRPIDGYKVKLFERKWL